MKKLIFILLILLVQNVPCQERHPITATDLWQLKRVSGLALSPDGATAAMVVTSYDLKENKGNGDIWLVNTTTGESKQFTTGKSTESSPAWSPDGSRIAFIAKREDNDRPQIYIISTRGGEARCITDVPLGAGSPRWFPDGRHIAFTSDVLPQYRGNLDSLKACIKRRKDSKISACASENRLWRYWDHYLTDGYVSHIFSVDVETRSLKDLTPTLDRLCSTDGSVAFDIAPDGAELAVSCLSYGAPYDTLSADLYLLQADGSGTMRNITSRNPGDDMDPRFTPDGRYILFGRTLDPRRNAERTRLMRYDRRSGEAVEICRSFDRNPSDWQIDASGGLVWFLAEDLARNSVFTVPITGGIPVRRYHDGVNSGLDAAGGTVAFLHQNSTGPNEAMAISNNGEVRVLTHFNDDALARLRLGERREAWYRGARGDSVLMFILTPPGFDPQKKWPLLVVLHGGPHGTSADDFHFRWNNQLFAAPGYVVVTPNFHGSTSFGEEFADCINGSHPEMPFEDVMRATDYMIAQGYIDSTCMAVAGGSYGGYLTAWTGGHTGRYACLIDHAGPYNLLAQYGSDVTHNRDVSYGGTPWDGRDNVLRWSPSYYARDYRTPTLVMHGEKDYRVPVSQGLELYGTLKAKNIPARIVVFPDENHWIQSPANSIDWYNEFHAWLGRWLKDKNR
jgi:dipeptidyl aminopeptidase/acylaminoacyl peptidase